MSQTAGSLTSNGHRLLAETACRLPAGIELLGPVYWIAGTLVSGASLYLGGIEAFAVTLAVLIALWSFADLRTSLCLSTAYMIFLFVFFQNEAPLGDELPQEFFYWGAGVAFITAGVCCATLFSRKTAWFLTWKRMSANASVAVAAMLVMTFAAAANGLWLGNQPFAVVRQLFGCVLLPVYFFCALAILRSDADVDRWLRGVNWSIALGALWYAEKLSATSITRGVYFREQSPLTTYAGAAGVIAFALVVERSSLWRRLQGLAQLILCAAAIVLMGNRAALASLVAACGLLVIVAVSRRGVLAGTLALVIVAGGIGDAFYFGNRFLEHRGVGGDIARRFIIRISEDRSFQGRMAQMEAVMATVRKSPVLGAGLGSETVFLAPEEGRLRLTSVDNGWGYVMLKMGLLGLAVFLAVLGLLLWRSLRHLLRYPRGTLRANTMALLGVLLYGVIVFWSGPAFLHFTSAGFFGTTFAAILVLADSRAAEIETAMREAQG